MRYRASQIARRLLAGCLTACALAAWTVAPGGCGPAGEETTVESGPNQAKSAVAPAAAPSVDVIDTTQLLELVKPGSAATVVNFWATWCPPCVEEMPELAKFYRDHANRGVKLVSVSVDHPDTIADRVEPFVRQKALPFPVHILSERSPENVSKALGVEWTGAVPATFLFDGNGRLIQSWFEGTTARDIGKAVDSLQSR